MLRFLTELTTDGRVRVSSALDGGDDVATIVRSADAAARAELAGDGPPLSRVAATWAAGVIEAGCRFLVYRAYDACAIADALCRPCPAPPGPSTSYSADLFLRHLPDLVRLARGLSADDPLVAHLTAVGRQWPLSSVGIPALAEAPLDVRPLVDHAALLQLYIDRIIDRGDAARLASATVRRAVRVALGDHAAALAPALAAALAPYDD